MKFVFIAVVVVAFFATSGESVPPRGSTNLAKGKSSPKPTAPAEMYNYKIFLKKVEVNKCDGLYAGNRTHVWVQMHNGSMPVINGKLDLPKDIPPNMTIRISGYSFSKISNQWIPSFDQGDQNYCEYAENNKSFMQNFYKAVDITECPVKKGLYTVTNMVIDEKQFPPGIPDSTFRVDIYFTIEGKKIGGGSIYVDILNDDGFDD